jgi:hypothetical protein
MGFVFTVATGLVIWIVLWSLDTKGIDAFMVTLLVVLLGITVRLLIPFLPNRDE